MGVQRLSYFGHNLDLCVNHGLKIDSVQRAVRVCRLVVAHFHRSWKKKRDLKKEQQKLGLPDHKLIHHLHRDILDVNADQDREMVKQLKRTISEDLQSRYSAEGVKQFVSVCSFLNPRFRQEYLENKDAALAAVKQEAVEVAKAAFDGSGGSRQAHGFDTSILPICKDSLGWMFNRLDTNYDLLLDQSELRSLYLDKYEHCTKSFFNSCDTYRDGLISNNEWCDCFQRQQDPPCQTELANIQKQQAGKKLLVGSLISLCKNACHIRADLAQVPANLLAA
ncbi:UNVERIFIED_CONTAM: hypothetical protein FKN15_051702 [Acipenser sinensis]